MSDTSALVGISIDANCLVDTTIAVGGYVQVERSNPRFASVQFPTVTGPPGHVGPDVIDTEIISMSLTGTDITLEAGTDAGMSGDATCDDPVSGSVPRSCGAIAETASDPSLADSFFEVYFRVDLGGGTFVYNHVPLPMTATNITCIPPVAEYEKGICLHLFDRPKGIANPIWIASLTTATHYTFPESNPLLGACCLLDGTCELLDDEDCMNITGATYHGDNTPCGLNGKCIPTVSEWGLVVMAMLVLAAATVVIMRRRAMVHGGS